MHLKLTYLNFYQVSVQIESDLVEIHELLQKDFSQFISPRLEETFFKLQVFLEAPPSEKIPGMVSTKQTLNSICYDTGDTLFCDYYGELLVILDRKTNTAQMYSQNISKIHEVAYLLILSKIGKKLDLMGLHKLHAFSVSYKDLAIVCMMPMKGGKSTLLMEFLKDKRFKIISDDIPLINLKGEVLPFPIKIGLSSKPLDLDVVSPEKNFYTMDRSHYGKKELLSLAGLPGRVESLDRKFKKVLLIEAFRYNAHTSILKKSDPLLSSKGLIKHGIIGIGLPMVMEYFWETGFRDFLIKAKILILRAIGFTSLLMRAKKMKLFLGKNPKEASLVIIDYVIENYGKM